MGDRANIEFKEKNGGTMYFYTHWHGFEHMKSALRKALAKRKRWDDSQCLARIIFCEIVRNADDETTDFGLSTKLYDNDRPIITVDINSQTIHIGDKSWSFEKFIT